VKGLGWLLAIALLFAGCPLHAADNKFNPKLSEEISPEFSQTVQTTIGQLPKPLQEWMVGHEVELIAGKFLTQIRPDLKGLTPRGYPQGSTWDMSEGLHDRGAVYLPEYKRYGGGSVERIEMCRVSQVLHHEVGHAIDYHEKFSQSVAFVTSFEREKSSLLAERPSMDNVDSLAYFLTPSVGGRKEAFAELFSAIHNPNPSPEARLMIQHFPDTYALVRDMVSKLEE
jgi:hypothetical protein